MTRMEDSPEFKASSRDLSKVKRVWILGSGFSRPLGGPLLADLFSPRFQAMVNAAYRSDPLRGPFLYVYMLFQWGAHPERRHFEHAEDFLTQLDDPAASPRFDELFDRAVFETKTAPNAPFGLDGLRSAARALMARECSMHVPNRIDQDERLIPYRDWAGRLTAEDAILTFNYDPLMERLLTDPSRKNKPRSKMRVVGLNDYEENQTCLFKMHGSLDWYSEQAISEVSKVSTTPHAPNYSPVVGVPGSTKYGLSRTPLFTSVWLHAHEALKHAKEVFVLGYSMPASDSYATQFLLNSLRKNTARDLAIHLVLGQPGFATQRLEQVLALTLSHRGTRLPRTGGKLKDIIADQEFKGLVVRTWAAYAQDFLAAWRPSAT